MNENLNEIKIYAGRLNNGTLRREQIPEDVLEDPCFIDEERKLGLRVFDKRGYDVINNRFFVHEIECGENTDELTFSTFEAYYEFLAGDIYEKSCYNQYIFDEGTIKEYNLKPELLKNDHFIDETIDDDALPGSPESKAFDEKEKAKKLFLKWVDKFSACSNSKEYYDTERNLEKSKCAIKNAKIAVGYLICNDPEKYFSLFMSVLNESQPYWLFEEMCFIYGVDRIKDAFEPIYTCSRSAANKQEKWYQSFFDRIRERCFTRIVTRKGFDSTTHFYYVNTDYFNSESPYSLDYYTEYRYFADFSSFARWLNNDISDCNLLTAKLYESDIAGCRMNDKTVLPISICPLKSEIKKYYDGTKFVVKRIWSNDNGDELSSSLHTFEFFFDFAYYLHNDLSNSDFIFCDGLANLADVSMYNLTGCKAKSDFFIRHGLGINMKTLPDIPYFEVTVENEEATELILQNKNEIMIHGKERLNYNKIAYISDLHLLHQFKNYNCRTEDDQAYVIKKVADAVCREHPEILLVGGDVSSEFEYYDRFLDELEAEELTKNTIFILGNHELWDFSGHSLDDIVMKYRNRISKKYYFLQNSILYKTSKPGFNEISEVRLKGMSIEQLRQELRCAQLIIFGGLAFSGFNDEFNADNGVYRGVITREEEIKQSMAFNALYEKICKVAYDKNVVVFTHTPKRDWSGNQDYQKGFIYVNGHTHRNQFSDDGEIRIYADNQIGYKKKTPFLKYFYITKEYDFFSDYEDGIYDITKEEFNRFFRGKNMSGECNRDGLIHMLKRNGYYCFIRDGKTGLQLMNGGQVKGLSEKDINYYFEHMLSQIDYLKQPLDKYAAIQEKIAEQVKAIGGSGYIHGCIVDIDFLNHIYVNPFDLTLTAYYALDMISKMVYKNISSLLKDKCPLLYENYKALSIGDGESILVNDVVNTLDVAPVFYFETDIYKASREIRKLQRLKQGVLSAWYDIGQEAKVLEGSDK